MAAEIKLPTWYRALAVIVGIFSIILSLIVLAFPALAVWLLIYLLAFALLLMGIDRIVAGISGHPFSWLMPLMPSQTGGGGTGTSTGAPPGPAPPKT